MNYPPLPHMEEVPDGPLVDLWTEAQIHEDLISSLMLSNIGDPWSRFRLQLTTGHHDPVPFHVHQLVKVTQPYVFASRQYQGRIGRVAAIHDARAQVPADVRDAVVVDVQILAGHDSMGKHVFDTQLTPFYPRHLAPLLEGEGDWVRGARLVSRCNWPRTRTGHSEAS